MPTFVKGYTRRSGSAVKSYLRAQGTLDKVQNRMRSSSKGKRSIARGTQLANLSYKLQDRVEKARSIIAGKHQIGATLVGHDRSHSGRSYLSMRLFRKG